MAGKRNKKRKNTGKRTKNKKMESFNVELVGFVVFCSGVLLTLSVCFQGVLGSFGNVVRTCVCYLFGDIIGVLFCAYILVAAVLIMVPAWRPFYYKKWIFITFMLMLLPGLISAICFDDAVLQNECRDSWLVWLFVHPANVIADAVHGGGLVGNLVSVLFLVIMQRTGSLIVLGMLIVIDFALMMDKLFFVGIKAMFGGVGRGVKRISSGVNDFATSTREQMQQEREQVDNGTYKPRKFGRDDDQKLERPSWMKKKEKKVKTFDLEEEMGVDISKDDSILDTLQLDFEKEETDELKNDGLVRNIIFENEVLEDAENGSIVATDDQMRLIDDGADYDGENRSSDKKSGEFCMSDIEEIEAEVSYEIAEGKAKKKRNYRLPTLDLLNASPAGKVDSKAIAEFVKEESIKLENTLRSFGVDAKVVNVTRGPSVTRYELHPGPGVKVSKVVNLSDDIALSLAASGIRIEAPIPGKSAIGIEVPNKNVDSVYLRDMLDSKEFKNHPSSVAVSIGKSISGEAIVADIAKMPHLLIAGTTGSGKSVCTNSMIISMLYKSKPDEVRFVMIDPKRVELTQYNGIPHLLIPVVTDPKKAAGALGEMVKEMTERYNLFALKGVKDIGGYNAMAKREGFEKMPHYVIIIDELADLMMVSPKEVEDRICRLAQMARAAGMHLVIATQTPRVDVITGLIKANIPSRIALSVASQIDSRTILDSGGAEKLLGNGDMLFHPIGKSKPIRVQGCFVSEEEVARIVEHVKNQQETEYNQVILENINTTEEEEKKERDEQVEQLGDELLSKAVEIVLSAGQASSSLLQRKLSVGYARAARIIDQMEERGIVGPSEGSKPRKLLVDHAQWAEMQMDRIKQINELNTSGDRIEPENLYNPIEKRDLSGAFGMAESTDDDFNNDEGDFF